MKKVRNILTPVLLIMVLTLSSCASGAPVPQTGDGQPTPHDMPASETVLPDDPTPAARAVSGSRDNTPYIPKQEASGTVRYENDSASIDASHTSDGYCMVSYTGTNPKVKLIITGPDGASYRYDLKGSSYASFPFTAGNGTYSLGVYENISGDSYSTAMTVSFEVTLTDEFRPYLCPSQYVSYGEDSLTVAMAAELARGAENDLDVVSGIYNYVIDNISYDHDKAAAPPTGYISDIDDTLSSGKGICLDYAAVMAAMLRSQHIPTRLEVGYAKDVYHAWISTYIKDIGWVNGIVQFDGKNWELMDPTFAANSGEKSLRQFIGDGANYSVKYMY